MFKSKLVVSWTALAFLITGCATNSNRSAVQSDQTATTAQGEGVWAVAGSLLGAVLPNDRGKGSLVGGIRELFSGAVVGDRVAQMRQQRIAKEASLDKQIAQMNKYRLIAENYQKKVRTKVARLARESTALQQSRQRGNLEKQAVQNRLAQIRRQRDDLNKTVVALADELTAKEKVAALKEATLPHNESSQRKMADLHKEMDQLRVAINAMVQEDRQLADMSSEWR